MNSFHVTAIGNLARDPEHTCKGESPYTVFSMLGNDYGGRDEQGNSREIVSSLNFVAFDSLGEVIAKHARKGDQLIVEAHIRSNNWVDKDGVKRFEHSYIVDGFRFGERGRAKREELAAKRDEREAGMVENPV